MVGPDRRSIFRAPETCKMVNTSRYEQQMHSLREALNEKRPEWREKHNKLILQHDNAPAHSATVEKITNDYEDPLINSLREEFKILYKEMVKNQLLLDELDQQSNKVWFHHDSATSHTSSSTQAYLEDLRQRTGINTIPKNRTPVKSPDLAPMDFCIFGCLKRALGKRHPRTIEGLWKVVKEEWDLLSMTMIRKCLLSWKIRIFRNSGSHHHLEKTNTYLQSPIAPHQQGIHSFYLSLQYLDLLCHHFGSYTTTIMGSTLFLWPSNFRKSTNSSGSNHIPDI
ncbi:hypothetical protein LAZ67_2003719 [Cordylochernes scorpioides]|uniref:Transposase n=1 Tax=Cordylochernes scorpioides TaxID=51811 RepID=A0ABY6K631_9ARAC|nr:hypothetical protein LAZ67_2003719 [Cordylochernes scorpioides]